MSGPRALGGLLAGALLLALAAPAPASDGLYRCRGPEGGTLFTSDPSRCRSPERHEPSGRVQRVPDSAAAAPSREPPAEVRRDGSLRRKKWRRRRERAEAELAAVREALPVLRRARGVCARGGEVEVEDRLGLYREVSCDSVEEALARVERREEELRRYLEEGLAEECRRAGCLPGWVRSRD